MPNLAAVVALIFKLKIAPLRRQRIEIARGKLFGKPREFSINDPKPINQLLVRA